MQKILGAHPEIHTLSEPWVALHPLFGLRSGAGISAPYEATLAVSAVSHFLQMLRDGEEVYWDGVRLLLTHIYDRALRPSGKRIFLDKTPRYYFVIPELRRVFPDARFVLLVRNPLAVLSSILETWVKSEDIAQLRPFRHDLLTAPQLLRDSMQKPSPNTVVVRYEELASAPEQVIRGLCQYLGVDFHPAMIEYGRDPGAERWQFGDQETVYQQNKPVPDHVERWRGVLKRSPVWEAWAHSYLVALGPNLLRDLGYDYRELMAELSVPAVPDFEAQMAGVFIELGGKSEPLLSLEQAAVIVRQQEQRIVAIEHTAGERLAALHDKEAVIASLSSQLQDAFARAQILEQAAGERLAALHDKDAAITGLHSQLQDAFARAQILEQAAGERLAALHDKDADLKKTHQLMKETLDRANSLEALAQTHLAAAQAAEAALNQLREELRRTESQLKEVQHRFETESLRAYMYRRLHREARPSKRPSVLE